MVASVYAQILLPVFFVIGAGWLFTQLKLDGTDFISVRRALSALVMNVWYPALILTVIPNIEIDFTLLSTAALYGAGLFTGLLFTVPVVAIMSRQGSPRTDMAPVILCAALGNIISIGIPVLQFYYGEKGAAYVISSDFIVVTPFLWTIGIWICMRFSDHEAFKNGSIWREVFKLPPIWAFVIAVLANFFNITVPDGLHKGFQILGSPTLPGLLLVIGMSLSLKSLYQYRYLALSVTAIKLVLVPLVVFFIASQSFISEDALNAGTLLSGLPTMMAILVLIERYRLNVELTTSILFATTFIYIVTLPAWAVFLNPQ